MREKRIFLFCVVFGLVIAAFITMEIKNGFESYDASAQPLEGNNNGNLYLLRSYEGSVYRLSYDGSSWNWLYIGSWGAYSDWVSIIVANVPPVANFSFTPSNPTDLDTIQFTDLSYDSDGFIVNYTWDFGDGSISYEQNPSHQYADDGTYNVTLTVIDDDGATDSITKQITILPEYKFSVSEYIVNAGKINWTKLIESFNATMINESCALWKISPRWEYSPYWTQEEEPVDLTFFATLSITNNTILTIYVNGSESHALRVLLPHKYGWQGFIDMTETGEDYSKIYNRTHNHLYYLLKNTFITLREQAIISSNAILSGKYFYCSPFTTKVYILHKYATITEYNGPPVGFHDIPYGDGNDEAKYCPGFYGCEYEDGETFKKYEFVYTNPVYAYLMGQTDCDNGEEEKIWIDDNLWIHQINWGPRAAWESYAYVLPHNISFWGKKTWSANRWSFWMAVVADNVSVNTFYEPLDVFTIIEMGKEYYLPKLRHTHNDIYFSDDSPVAGQTITISVNISNIGLEPVYNLTVYFYTDRAPPDKKYIGFDVISYIPVGGSAIASVEWNAIAGTHYIRVIDEFNSGDGGTNISTLYAYGGSSREIIVLPGDTIPPITTKSIGNPKYGSNNEWINLSTPIWLNATDDISGVNFTYYEIWWDSDNNGVVDTQVENVTIYDNDANDMDPSIGNISVEFRFNEECLHEIRWYSVDNAGNVEDIHNQIHYVDNSPPETTLDFKGPIESGYIEKIVFVSDRSGNPDIWIMNPDGTDLKQLTNDPAADYKPVISPDGTKILFISERTGSSQVWIMNSDGTEQHQLFDISELNISYPYEKRVLFATWTPNGSYIIAQISLWGVHPVPWDIIYRFDPDGSNPEVFLDWGPSIKGKFDISPDGTKFVYAHEDSNYCSPTLKIYIANIEEGKINESSIILLSSTDDGQTDDDVIWFPDEKKILWKKSENPAGYGAPHNLYSMNINETNITKLTNFVERDAAWPDFSPNGTRVVFQIKESNKWGIYTINPYNGSGINPLLVDQYNNYQPNWGKIKILSYSNLSSAIWIDSSTSIYINATDIGCNNGSGIKEIHYSYDNGSTWYIVNEDSVVFTIPDDEKHVILYYAVDNLGNTEKTHKIMVLPSMDYEEWKNMKEKLGGIETNISSEKVIIIYNKRCPISKIFGEVIEEYQDPAYRGWVFTGYNPDIENYDWEWTNPNPDPNAGNNLDLIWMNPLGKKSYVIWDLGCTTNWVRVYPTQDHLGYDYRTGEPNTDPDNPYEVEYHEYDVYVSTNPSGPWQKLNHSILWLEGYQPDPAIADDAVKDYYSPIPFRYVKIMPNELAGKDCEIDAVGVAIFGEYGDIIPPVISDIIDAPDPQEKGRAVNISCRVFDNIGVASVKVNITYPDGTVVNETMLHISGTNIYYFNASYSNEGVYEYFIWAEDTSGNVVISSVYKFHICNESISYETGSGENIINATDVGVQLVINATGNATIGVGEYSINPAEVSPTGLVAVGNYVEINIDNESAVDWPIYIAIYYTQADLDSTGINEDDILGMYYYDEQAGMWRLYNNTGVNTSDIIINGIAYAGYVWAYAYEGQLSPKMIGANPPPATSCILSGEGNHEWYRSDVVITLKATDNAEVNATYYKLDNGAWRRYYNPFTVSDSGEHVLSFYSIDNLGKVEKVKTKRIKIDKTLPSTEIMAIGNESNGWYTEDVMIGFIANDSYSGVDETIYRIDEGEWHEYKTAMLIWQEGKHIIEYYSIDRAGNAELVNSFELKIDKYAPDVTVIYPNGGEIVNDTVNIQWNAEDISDVIISIYCSSDNGTTWHLIAANEENDGLYEWNTDSAKDGTNYKIKIVAEDEVGHVSMDTSDNAFIVYNNFIETKIEQPKTGFLYINNREVIPLPGNITIIIGKIDIVAEVNCGLSVEKVEFYIDKELKYTAYAEPYTWEWDERAFLMHEIEIVAHDCIGYTATSRITVWIFNI